MADMFSTGNAWLESMRANHASTTISYSRGSDPAAEIGAMLGRSEHPGVDRNGFYQRVESRDFIVGRSDLVAAGVWPPLRGDKITDGSYVYEVLPPVGEQVYKFCDAHRNTVRIHTKLLSSGA